MIQTKLARRKKMRLKTLRLARELADIYFYLTSSFRWNSKSDGWKYVCLIWLTYFTNIIFIFHFIVTVRAEV